MMKDTFLCRVYIAKKQHATLHEQRNNTTVINHYDGICPTLDRYITT